MATGRHQQQIVSEAPEPLTTTQLPFKPQVIFSSSPSSKTTATPTQLLTTSSTPTPAKPWSSLVEGDEQLDRPNSQTTVELCHASVA